MAPWIQIVITVFTSVLASSGLWAYLARRTDRRDAKTQMLVGLAHDRILYLGTSYIERGYISNEEYENLHDYLYKPYQKIGGNGSAERVMNEVKLLPTRNK